jgi:hypothetical protein
MMRKNYEEQDGWFLTLLIYLTEGRDSPRRKAEKNASELLGLKSGTACPAPLNVANVSPSYSWNQPLT